MMPTYTPKEIYTCFVDLIAKHRIVETGKFVETVKVFKTSEKDNQNLSTLLNEIHVSKLKPEHPDLPILQIVLRTIEIFEQHLILNSSVTAENLDLVKTEVKDLLDLLLRLYSIPVEEEYSYKAVRCKGFKIPERKTEFSRLGNLIRFALPFLPPYIVNKQIITLEEFINESFSNMDPALQISPKVTKTIPTDTTLQASSKAPATAYFRSLFQDDRKGPSDSDSDSEEWVIAKVSSPESEQDTCSSPLA